MNRFNRLSLYILKRIVLLVLSFIVIFTICFFLIRLLPVSIEEGPGKDPEVYQRIMKAYGRDKPIIVQFFIFIKNIFHPYYVDDSGITHEISRFGYSWNIDYLSTPFEMLNSRIAPTVIMNLYSIVISIPLGIALGIYMALRKNRWQDNVLNIVIMIFISVPSFVYAFFVQYLFAFKLNLVPLVMPPLEANMTWFSPEIQKAMIAPVIAMSFGSIAGFARTTRAELSEILTSDYIVLAKTKGLTSSQAIIRHGFRNALVPIFPMILGQFISILGGSIIIETIFGIPGVGSIFLQSINLRDYDVFLFFGMFYTLIGLIGGLVVDVSYEFIDPRMHIGSKGVSYE